MIAKGTFDVSVKPEPPYEVIEGVSLGEVRLDKRFAGALEATSTVRMIGARTAVEGSAGYVAIERVSGALGQQRGTFVLQHSGIMTRGALSLTILVVPASGTGELRGLSGQMEIQVLDGQHHYTFDYQLAG